MAAPLATREDYEEEAGFFLRALQEACAPLGTVLELGSGGGSNAYHLQVHCAMTLVDASPGMLEVSRSLNPECEHLVGRHALPQDHFGKVSERYDEPQEPSVEAPGFPQDPSSGPAPAVSAASGLMKTSAGETWIGSVASNRCLVTSK